MENVKTQTTEQQMAEYNAMKARIAQLEAEVAAKNSREIKFQIAAEKGGIMASGVNAKFPVVLYYEQWVRLIETATGQKLPETSPIAVLAKKGEKYLAVKGESAEVAAVKKALRLAETQGLVKQASKTFGVTN